RLRPELIVFREDGQEVAVAVSGEIGSSGLLRKDLRRARGREAGVERRRGERPGLDTVEHKNAIAPRRECEIAREYERRPAAFVAAGVDLCDVRHAGLLPGDEEAIRRRDRSGGGNGERSVVRDREWR